MSSTQTPKLRSRTRTLLIAALTSVAGLISASALAGTPGANDEMIRLKQAELKALQQKIPYLNAEIASEALRKTSSWGDAFQASQNIRLYQTEKAATKAQIESVNAEIAELKAANQ